MTWSKTSIQRNMLINFAYQFSIYIINKKVDKK